MFTIILLFDPLFSYWYTELEMCIIMLNKGISKSALLNISENARIIIIMTDFVVRVLF